jgi:hypothetical protein
MSPWKSTVEKSQAVGAAISWTTRPKKALPKKQGRRRASLARGR